MRVTLYCGLTLATLTTFGPPAIALPAFTATTSDGSTETNFTAATSSGFVSGPLSPDDSTFIRQETAFANSGGLRASARVTTNVVRPAGAPGFNHSASARATFKFDDFLILGPGTTTSASINFNLDGTFATGIINLNNLFSAVLTSTIGFDITGRIVGQPFSGTYSQTHELASGLFASGNCNPCESTSAAATGIIEQGPLPVNIVTPIFDNLPVNTPFGIELSLGVNATAIYQFGGSSCNDSGCSSAFNIDSLSDFSNTLTFSTSGPVMNFSGNDFTLFSEQAGIRNNQIVPEPSTLILVGLMLTGPVGRNWARTVRQ